MTTPVLSPDPAAAPAPPALRRPRVWTLYLACAILAALQYALSWSVVRLILFRASGGGISEREALDTFYRVYYTPGVFFGLLAAFTALGGAMALALAARSSLGLRCRLALARPATTGLTVILLALGCPALGQFAAMALDLFHTRTYAGAAIGQVTRTGGTGALVLAVLVVGLLGPACEELFFRGYLQTRLVARHGPAWGILIAALLFGLYHREPVHAAMAAVLGVFLGLLAWRTASLLPAILAHATNNTLSVLGQAFSPRNAGFQVLLFVLAGTFFTASVYLLVRLPPPLPPARSDP